MNPLSFGRGWRLFASRCVLLLMLAFPVGCSATPGTVSGQVLYKGKPLPGGWVIFRPADNTKNTVTAPIDANGHYEATVPAGEVKIAVDNRELQQPSDRGVAKPPLPPGVKLPPVAKPAAEAPAPVPESAPQRLPGTYVAIPIKYYDVDSSSLKYSVKSGPQSYNIELN